MAIQFDGAKAVITGGANGIGLALAKRMQADGAKLAICDVNMDALNAAREHLPGALFVQCDVSDHSALEGFIDQAVDHLGGIDVGWNNAGIMQMSRPVQEIDWVTYQRVMDINLHAVFRGSQIMAAYMIEQGTPALLINTGSENSLFHAVPGGGAYVASKMGVRAITESFAQDTPDFIDVKLLCPGFVNTALGPEAQFQHGMDVEQFADIAYPLLTSDQFYLVSHGYNAVRVRQSSERILNDIRSGASTEADTKQYDTYTLMGLDQ